MADNAPLVLPHVRAITAAAMSLWHWRPVFRQAGMEAGDAAQTALCHCLRYGTRWWDGVVPHGTYFRKLGRAGMWQAVALHRARLAKGYPQLQALPADVPSEAWEPPCPWALVEGPCLDRLEVAAALLVLTPREREAVLHRYGLAGGPPEASYAEIGGRMGISSGTVRTLLHNAHTRLRGHYQHRRGGCGD